MLLARSEFAALPRFSSIGDTSRIDRNLRGWPELAEGWYSGSGELGGETSSYAEGEVFVGFS
jgi:hypothetical protein